MERLVNRSLLTILATLLVAAVLAPDFARAEDVVERVVVRNRKHTTWQKFEVTPTVGFTLTNRLTSHTNFQLGLAYNFSEAWALELRPGFALGSITDVGDQARPKIYENDPFASGNTNLKVDDFQDMWTMEWQALLMPRWTPIYGKLNLVTELPIHFQAYLTAGGGAVGLKRESIAYCQNGATDSGSRGAECRGYLEESKATWAASAGGGFRFFISDAVLLRLEMFDIVHPDEYRTGIVLQEAEREQPGADPQAGKLEQGITNVLMFNVGASVVF
ncbi:outer membrane beta-barrel domain-containing protein [Vulgatibacter sp.]|uniref:outer membrane beta-barrel domain-containing protein n=1 Tax=Vulgatibacter sp. TaxID=1971226 RepID=UPI003565C1D8